MRGTEDEEKNGRGEERRGKVDRKPMIKPASFALLFPSLLPHRDLLLCSPSSPLVLTSACSPDSLVSEQQSNITGATSLLFGKAFYPQTVPAGEAVKRGRERE